jgi:transaldolase
VLPARPRAARIRGRRPDQGCLGGELLRLAHRHRGRPAPDGALQALLGAQLAYAHYLGTFTGPRWEYLASKGATPQRVLWASTSTKNPAYPDTLYVEELIGPDTVNTMPEETIEAYQDHGDPQPRLQSGLEEAQRLLTELERVGVDYDDLTDTLEREGVEKFAGSFHELLQALSAKQQSLALA